MYARRNWLGYLAIGLGLVALVVSLSGRMDGSRGRGGMQTAGDYRGRNGPVVVAPGVQPPAAVPAAPNAAQGAADPRFGAGRGPIGDVGRPPFGHPFGGVVPLVGGLFVIGLGLALFVAPGRRGRRGGHQGGPSAGQPVSGEQNRQPVAAVYPAAAPQPQPAAPAEAPAPPQTPPASAHTGETTRLYDF